MEQEVENGMLIRLLHALQKFVTESTPVMWTVESYTFVSYEIYSAMRCNKTQTSITITYGLQFTGQGKYDERF